MFTRIWPATTLLLAVSASAYVRQPSGYGGFIHRADNAAIQIYINDKMLPGFVSASTGKTVITQGSDPQAALQAALAAWNGASSANIHFLPHRNTSIGIDQDDSFMVVGIAANASDISAVGSALAITPISWSSAGVIRTSDIIVNPGYSFSTFGRVTAAGDPFDLQSVLTHELGVALGAGNTNVVGAAMFGFAVGTFQRLISSDDVAFLNAAYPSSAFPVPGSIGGRVTLASGTPVAYPLIAVIDSAAGVTIGALGDAGGIWSVSVPPGSYLVYAEPFNTVVTASSVGVTRGTAFESTVLGGASPTLIRVTAGS